MMFQPNRHKLTRSIWLGIVSVFFLLVIWRQSIGTVHSNDVDRNTLKAAHERVIERESYSFNTDVLQITIPEASLDNLGNTSSEERLFLTGSTNVAREEMHMILRSDAWQDGGSVLIPTSGIEIEMADGQTRARQGQGEWEPLAGFTDSFAPQGDFLSFLIASGDVQAHEPETRNGFSFTRYSFTIDGESFAAHARDQMQAEMMRRGELPPNTRLEASPVYAGMTGTGELWIGEEGLPLRQILNLRFPPDNGERVVAQITTDFSEFGDPPLHLDILPSKDQVVDFGLTAVSPLVQLTASLLLLFGLFTFRRQRATLLEKFLRLTVASTMLLTPILQVFAPMGTAHAQGTTPHEQEAQHAEQEEKEALKEFLTEEPFDPHTPIAADALDEPIVSEDGTPMTLGDSLNEANNRAVSAGDTDGLSDEIEDLLGTDKNNNHTDNDGLDDFQEISLGTDPRDPDTDDDLINDKQEEVGFEYAEHTWYLDPKSADSNRDGIPDGLELGADSDNNGIIDLLEVGNPKNAKIYDHDGDNIPDIALSLIHI